MRAYFCPEAFSNTPVEIDRASRVEMERNIFLDVTVRRVLHIVLISHQHVTVLRWLYIAAVDLASYDFHFYFYRFSHATDIRTAKISSN